ncbi:MAG: nucleotidyltransferase [Candidatus Cloacimonetes bacterium]|jgi:hypothetical protein|nr:nucleotidyltransferase [Candidatus Cloacimonadota bacterium]
MSIPESQLETWSHIGAQATAKATHESVRRAIDNYSFPDGIKYNMFMQGSYKNGTNTYGNMDVDLIACLTSSFYSNLTVDQCRQLRIVNQSYGFRDFKNDILFALLDFFGITKLDAGSKAIRIRKPINQLDCDVIACTEYRHYYAISPNSYYEGVTLWTKEGTQIVNYPKYHYENGVSKNQRTNGNYKPTVRVFKNMRNKLVANYALTEHDAPSYFVECLLHNIPDNLFASSYSSTTLNVLNYLYRAKSNGIIEKFKCQHGLYDLFGTGNTQWNLDAAKTFITKSIGLWNEWS